LDEAIACNTTAFLNESRTEGLGNPTEVALLLWMQGRGSDYMKVRQGVEEVARLPFQKGSRIAGDSFIQECRILILHQHLRHGHAILCQCSGLKVRQGVEEVARLPFSSERKYMATIVNSSVLGRKVVYVKGAAGDSFIQECRILILHQHLRHGHAILCQCSGLVRIR